MVSPRLFDRFYGDHLKWDGTRAFYEWVRQHTAPETVMLNLGAGPPTDRDMRVFKGEVRRVAGADIDRVVLENYQLDDAHVIDRGILPFQDETFDIVYSDFVMEHVEDGEKFMREAFRVCKLGGSYFFRTPNKHHYVSLISRVTPHWFHNAVANRVRRMPEDSHEPWPTFYELNSRAAIRRHSAKAGFRVAELRMIEMEPSYLVFHSLLFLAGVAYERIVNSTEMLAGLRCNILGRLVK